MSYHLSNLKYYFTNQIFFKTSKNDPLRENFINNLNLLTSLSSKCEYTVDYVLICHNIAFHTGYNYIRVKNDIIDIYKNPLTF